MTEADEAIGQAAVSLTADTDEQLVVRASLGEDRAFGALVERHSQKLFRLAWRMSHNESDAEDAVQETFLRTYRQLRRFDARSKFSTWLYRICVNYTLDLIRNRGRQPLTAMHADEETTDLAERVASDRPDPERQALSREVNSRVQVALARLTESERAAFVLRHYEGLGIEDIARILGVRAGAAKNTVFRAVQKLRRELQPLVGAAELGSQT
jgi:RNA polymerase sigma-70 factor (ECF subfamily)